MAIENQYNQLETSNIEKPAEGQAMGPGRGSDDMKKSEANFLGSSKNMEQKIGGAVEQGYNSENPENVQMKDLDSRLQVMANNYATGHLSEDQLNNLVKTNQITEDEAKKIKTAVENSKEDGDNLDQSGNKYGVDFAKMDQIEANSLKNIIGSAESGKLDDPNSGARDFMNKLFAEGKISQEQYNAINNANVEAQKPQQSEVEVQNLSELGGQPPVSENTSNPPVTSGTQNIEGGYVYNQETGELIPVGAPPPPSELDQANYNANTANQWSDQLSSK